MKTLALFLFIAIASAQRAIQRQELAPTEFLAQIVHHMPVGESFQPSAIAYGTLVTRQFVLTTASRIYAFKEAKDQLRVYLQSIYVENSTDIRELLEITIHNDFNSATPHANDLAMIKFADSDADNIRIEPRDLGNMEVGNCRTFIALNQVIRTFEITITSENCAYNQPFCGTVTDISACQGYHGMPVICENINQIAGITNSMDCAFVAPVLNGDMTFMNIRDHEDWIRRVSGAEKLAQVSMMLIFLGAVVSKFI